MKVKQSWKKNILGLLGPWRWRHNKLWNGRNQWPSGSEPHSRRLKSSPILLWEPQVTQICFRLL